jgi:hypothetical protein
MVYTKKMFCLPEQFCNEHNFILLEWSSLAIQSLEGGGGGLFRVNLISSVAYNNQQDQ